MKKIAVYGKGGIGKSTTAANLTAALSRLGYRVMQIGCDPKSDSTVLLTGGKSIPTVLDTLREKKNRITMEDVVFPGSCGCHCIEAGGPRPGTGCAGRGIITTFDTLTKLGVYEAIRPDVVLFDVLGDVVCGGFATPIRQGYADEVVIVTSGEKMSLYAAGNIAMAVRDFGARGYASLRGIIANQKGFEGERAAVEDLAQELELPVLAWMPRSGLIQQAEDQCRTEVETFPESELTKDYLALAARLMEDAT